MGLQLKEKFDEVLDEAYMSHDIRVSPYEVLGVAEGATREECQSSRTYRQTDGFGRGQIVTFWTLQSPELINGFNSVKDVDKVSISALKFLLLWGFHFWIHISTTSRFSFRIHSPP
jgi:hypothetical protein